MTLPTASRRKATTQVRDQQAAIRNLATARHVKKQADLRDFLAADPRPLEAIASDIGELMAETVFQGIDQLRADWDEHCKTWGLCGR